MRAKGDGSLRLWYHSITDCSNLTRWLSRCLGGIMIALSVILHWHCDSQNCHWWLPRSKFQIDTLLHCNKRKRIHLQCEFHIHFMENHWQSAQIAPIFTSEGGQCQWKLDTTDRTAYKGSSYNLVREYYPKLPLFDRRGCKETPRTAWFCSILCLL